MPWFREQFPDCPDWSNETLDLVANEVKPDFIRVEADEVTYNLHIMIRYEIEDDFQWWTESRRYPIYLE